MIDFNIGKVKYYDYELLEQLSNDLSLDYSIATHSIFLDKTSISQLPEDFKDREKATHKDIARNIMATGLTINHKYEDVFCTMWGYGFLKRILENDLKRKETFIKYNYWKETKVNNIIIAVPPKIRLDGKEYFVGVLEKNPYSVRHDFPHGDNLLNHMLLSHKIPSEFIYGFYSRDTFSFEFLETPTIESFEGKKIFQLEKNLII